jgi:bifunctional enzyme CysN/CysC
MAVKTTPSPSPVEDFLARHAEKDLLRFITCGSVDDGKSTLIGRLLWDSKLLFDDQRATLEQDSRTFGTAGDGSVDFALLVDGLSAEREQGITIDVAYRFFQSDRRKFIVADTPGHEQYTRNMATGASTADLAVILVDARHGVMTQTRRHATIVSLMGIEHVVLAVNKMDLIDWDVARFDAIQQEFSALAISLNITHLTCIPLSARHGDNVFNKSDRSPWFESPTLMEHLETVNVADHHSPDLRLPVQWVNRPDQSFRGFAGTICGGRLTAGTAIRVVPSGREATVSRIVTYDGDVTEAGDGDAVTVVLDREIDISRGDVILARDDRTIAVADQLQAQLIWMGEDELVPGRAYVMRLGTATASATIMSIKHRLSVNTQAHEAANTLALNEVGTVSLSLDHPLAFDPYTDNRATGGFILIDRFTNATVAAGMIDYALRRASNVVWHTMEVTAAVRAEQKGQKPVCLWFTGLSGSGKSTLANMLDKRLVADGRHTYIIDGDNIRHGLNHDLGFTEADRVENIRRIAEVAKLMVDAGLVVLVCAISPYRKDRQFARGLFADGQFVEVFVDTPLEDCEARDPKGLYRKARDGEIPNFTGISSPYERPDTPDLTVDGRRPVEDLVADVLASKRFQIQ